MSPPRIALFGTASPLSMRASEALAARFPLACVVLPAPPPASGLRAVLRRYALRRAQRPFARLARSHALPLFRFERQAPERLAAALAAAGTELLCVASFPYLLPPAVLAVPRLGAINVHTSLLPRHRGPDPLFWTYLDDDRETGVSVHWIDEGIDSGDLVYQEPLPLARGRPLRDLYLELAGRGVELLVRAVEAAAGGSAPRVPQDQTRATREPAPGPGRFRIDVAGWGAERVWHVLAGLGGIRPLLEDARGRLLRHGPARAFALERHGRPPGTIERGRSGFSVYCRDGVVDVAR